MNTKEHYKEFDPQSLLKVLPTYSIEADAETNSALSYIRNESMFCDGFSEFYEAIHKASAIEGNLYLKFGNDTNETSMKTCFNILFGPIEDVPLYISVEGYSILAKFRLSLENKKG